jgi:hypothetical protein
MNPHTEKDIERKVWLMLLKSFHRSATLFLKGLSAAIKLIELDNKPES